MSDVIDWSKAPEWATHALEKLREPDRNIVYWSFFVDGEHRVEPNGLWYHPDGYRIIQSRPTTPSWSGEGLPPVGAIVGHVVSGDKDYPFTEWASGDKLEVIAHREVCGVMLPIVFNLRHNTATAIQPHLLKQIRATEQIAADERNDAIAHIVAQSLGRCDSVGAAYIYDAGYRRKQ